MACQQEMKVRNKKTMLNLRFGLLDTKFQLVTNLYKNINN